ncbi:HAAS signaling domain-containing protein [Micromonospora sp. NPDC005806]|uniref:HAAS signaling domain-containing protein n=1 Tax=Micromonospora sp. NPDC005806 TaxID=3364234 RepID=UPI0036B6ACB1
MTVTGQDISDYVDRVRAALADLPPAVRDELTEDLPEHLAEVAAETDGTLVDRLGEPEAYAAELRAAAGADGTAGPPSLDRRLAAARHRVRARLSRLDARLGPILGYASAGEFLRLLRPAWWVLRGYLAAALLGAMTGGGLTLLPRPFQSEVLGIVLLAAAVLASIALGRNADQLRRWPRRLNRLGTLVLVVFGLVLLVNLDERSQRQDFYEGVTVGNPYDSVQDVFVYDEQGRLVTNARLFDQNGVPIRLGWPTCVDGSGAVPPPRNVYPYCPEQAPFAPPRPSAPPPVPTVSASPTTATPTGSAPPAPGVLPTVTAPAASPTGPVPAPTATR